MESKQYIVEIKEILSVARNRAYSAVNIEMIKAYWFIGKRIVEEEQNGKERAAYGEGLIKELSKSLSVEFGKGFSVANLKNFRTFYFVFPNLEKSYALRSQLTWTHYRLIMRVGNEGARSYYVEESSRQQWSSRELERQIRTKSFERVTVGAAQAKGQEIGTHQSLGFTNDFIKDPYLFEFLNIPQSEKVSETELETALVSHLQSFLLEMGNGFAFMGRQYRISTETSHFYIDLVFYNYILKCFVIVDLKTGKLTHQDVGQLDMYVRMFDDLKRGELDNPTIGIILCTDKDETIVKYSVLNDSDNLFASKYVTYLPNEVELKKFIEHDRYNIEQRLKDKNNETS